MTKSDQQKADLLFEKWKAELKLKDRSRVAVEGNFDQLFSVINKSKIPFAMAYEIMGKAIKAHMPSDEVVKGSYNRIKSVIGKTKDQYEKDWKENIDAKGKQVFYSYYNIDGTVGDTNEETKYGSMSATEYRKQRAYVEAMPILDWENIKWDLKEEAYDPSQEDSHE
jgi:hypothetical protein